MLIQLAILGLLAAVIPLTVVWVSKDSDRYRKLVWVTLFLTFDLIMFGAFTRLTDSGLGCPDWPGCYGHANPFQAHAEIKAAEAAMPTGPVTVVKAWIEMLHRYFAMGVGVLIITVLVVAVRGWWASNCQDQKFLPHMPLALLVFVCMIGAFGALTVTEKLQPVFVTAHLLLAMTLLAMLTWHAARQSEHAPVSRDAVTLRVPALIALVVLTIQIALGGWVSTNYAALACMDYPLCHGEVIPDMDFRNAFHLWRELGMTATGEYLSYPALTAIHWTHRHFAYVAVTVIAWTGCRAMKVEGMQRTGRYLLAAVCAQFLIGVSTVFLKWPLALAVAHNGMAAVLVGLLVMLNFKARLPAVIFAPQAGSRQTKAEIS